MSFNVWASGSGNFNFVKKNAENGSSFDLIKAISALQSLDFQSKAHLGITGAGAGIDIAAPGITDLIIAHAEREMLHNISNAVCLLTMNGGSGGWISINAIEHNTFFPDVARSASYYFSPGHSPGSEFISKIRTCMDDTGLATFGALLVLSVILTRFANHIDPGTEPKLSINLDNN